jgi:hypothetical protein
LLVARQTRDRHLDKPGVVTAFFDADPTLRRLERRAIWFCVTAAAISVAVRGGRLDMAAGVLCGGALIAVSYWAIRSSVGAIVVLVARASPFSPPAQEGDGGVEPAGFRPGSGAILLRLAGRYALLGLMAYAMIARLRVHPIGLLIGTSSLLAAASLEAFRVAASAGRNRPRP